MKSYSDDPEWADVVPTLQDDGELNSLAAIAYTEDYSEAMSYLRSVMANNELSERVLDLTEHLISLNPSHYTVWSGICSLHSVDCTGTDDPVGCTAPKRSSR